MEQCVSLQSKPKIIIHTSISQVKDLTELKDQREFKIK